MNQELIQNKFPTLQRSGATVSASGVPGSSARPSLAPNQQSHSRAIQIQSISRPLFEEGTEGPNIGTFTNDDQFLISESTVRGKYPKQQLVAPILTQRASAPPLKDYDARIMRLPRKTSLALGKLKRKKKSRKGRKTNEQKRRRSLSPRRRTSRIRVPPPPPAPKPRPARPLSPDTRNWSEPSTQTPELSLRKPAPFLFRRARKTAFQETQLPSATPTPPPPDNQNSRLALDTIAQGIFRLDPPLARYSLRSTPLFLARNLRDGWAGKVWAWDKAGIQKGDVITAHKEHLRLSQERLEDYMAQVVRQRSRDTLADISQASLPRTFCIKLKSFELMDLARMGVPDYTKLAAALYINNPSGDPLVFDLGESIINIPPSTSNFFPSLHRIPPLEACDMKVVRPNTLVPFFVKTTGDDAYTVSLRALSLPGGIAYVDLFLYDFTDKSGSAVTWGASAASRLYTRIELVGPNASLSGYAASTQRTQLTWLRSTIDPVSFQNTSAPTEHQHQAFLHTQIEWGVDSAARLPCARVSKLPPLRPRPPPPDTQMIYWLSVQGEGCMFVQTMQPWMCALCSICAPFPSLHILRVHIERAHPQAEVTIGKEQRGPHTNKRSVEIKVVLPPVSVELVSDDEIEIPEHVAPSTRIGALLAAQHDHRPSPPNLDMSLHISATPPLAPALTPDIPEPGHDEEPRVSNLDLTAAETESVKEEDESFTIPVLQAYEPITRLESRTPEPSLGSPLRPVANRTGFLHGYSSRINNYGRIYDVLRELPVKTFGVLAEQVVACEEELFVKEATYGSRAGIKAGSERGRLLAALWARWMVTNRNKFIRNPSECINRFLESIYVGIIADHVGQEHLQGFLLSMVARRFITSKQAAALMKKFKRYLESRDQHPTE